MVYPIPTEVRKLLNTAILSQAVGSQVTCIPAPPLSLSDIDYIVLVENLCTFIETAQDSGFLLGGSLPTDPEYPTRPHEQFASVTFKCYNLIVTASTVFFDRFILATHLCKRFNLLDKADRIALFQAVLYSKMV